MKMNLAAHALSSIVADAIEYCCDVLKLHRFNDCYATAKFIRLLDHLFNIHNSRNQFATGYKSPLRMANKITWNTFLDEAFEYILGLKDASGTPVHASRRKAGFLGCLIAIKSTEVIFQDYI